MTQVFFLLHSLWTEKTPERGQCSYVNGGKRVQCSTRCCLATRHPLCLWGKDGVEWVCIFCRLIHWPWSFKHPRTLTWMSNASLLCSVTLHHLPIFSGNILKTKLWVYVWSKLQKEPESYLGWKWSKTNRMHQSCSFRSKSEYLIPFLGKLKNREWGIQLSGKEIWWACVSVSYRLPR